MKEKTKKTLKIVSSISIFLCVIGLMVWNLISAYNSQCGFGANWFTALAGCISGIATAILGGIALWQNKEYKKQNEKKEKEIDFSVENIKITTYSIPDNFLGRICDSRDENLCMERFYITVCNYFDKPIFDIKISKYDYNNKSYLFSLEQPIKKDTHGKSFLIKNELMYLTANLPKSENLGNYKVTMELKNMNGEVFMKELIVNVFMDAQGKSCVLKSQSKAKLLEEQKNG